MSTTLNAISYIDAIANPSDLRAMSFEQLQCLADEIRQEVIARVSKTGGHLASNLGVVEITLALHSVFDSPRDKFIWDVGHQVYIHKMLTGRREQFDSLRQYKGLSGFVNPSESEHDSFIAGHSSTSLSLAVGMAIARDQLKLDHKVVAIIGDGGLTGGMALEAINHLGHLQKDVIIVLNDNEMSISANLGGFSQYMKRIKETYFYKDIKETFNRIEDNLDHVDMEPGLWELIKQFKLQAKQKIETPGIVFEKLGINYTGPVDGHNVEAVASALKAVSTKSGPQLVHVITQKGKGYAPAEADSIKYHGVSAFSPEKVEPVQVAKPKAKTYSQVFTETLIAIAENDEKLIAITPATAEGSGLVKFGEVYPERFFDVAICEQHAVTMAAGMAKSGLKPVVSIYSTFLQRAVDQVIHDVAILNLPVILGIDRGGLVEDGETHQGVFDIAHMRAIPNMRVYAPRNAPELANILHTLVMRNDGPAAVRFPRDKAIGLDDLTAPQAIDIDRWEILHQGNGPVLLAYGSMAQAALDALPVLSKEGIDATVVYARSCKPLDEDMLQQFICQRQQPVVTIEEGCLPGGFGSAVLEWAAATRYTNPETSLAAIACLGIPDAFVEHGARNILLDLQQLSPTGIASFVSRLRQNKC